MIAELNSPSPQTHYDSVADDYNSPEHESFYGGIAASLLSRLPGGFQPRAILEVGGGTGFSTALLEKAFPDARIVMVEPSKNMAALAAGRLGPRVSITPELPIRTAPRSDGPLRRGFDLVFSSMALHWLSAEERISAAELVAGHGLFAVAAPGRLNELPALGNKVLLKIIRQVLSARPDSHLAHSSRGITGEQLSTAYKQLTQVFAANECVKDSFPAESFSRSLEVRGALRALFGNSEDAERACHLIDGSVSSLNPCSLNSSIRSSMKPSAVSSANSSADSSTSSSLSSSLLQRGATPSTSIEMLWPITYWIGRAQ